MERNLLKIPELVPASWHQHGAAHVLTKPAVPTIMCNSCFLEPVSALLRVHPHTCHPQHIHWKHFCMCRAALDPQEGGGTVAYFCRVPYMVIKGLCVFLYFSRRHTRCERKNLGLGSGRPCINITYEQVILCEALCLPEPLISSLSGYAWIQATT